MTARHTPKIGAGQKPALPYEYDSALNMHLLGPGEPAATEWRDAGLRMPDMAAIREYRLARVQAELRARNIAAAVLTDPLNIRYAADSTNMQLWTAHNAARYCVVVADGPMIVFDYHQCEHLSAHNPLIDEIRPRHLVVLLLLRMRIGKSREKMGGRNRGHRPPKRPRKQPHRLRQDKSGGRARAAGAGI